MVCEYINPFDLECLFVNTLSGTWTLFILLAIAGIIILAARLKMPMAGLGLSVVVFGFVMSTNFTGLSIAIIVIGSLVVFVDLGMKLKR